MNYSLSKKKADASFASVNTGEANSTCKQEKDIKLQDAAAAASKSIPADKPVVSSDSLPSRFKFSSGVLKNGKPVLNYTNSISFPNPSEYSSLPGVTSFRGNNYRNSASYGFVDVKEKKLEKVWSFKTGFLDTWTGVGWTGQPAIVKWDSDMLKIMNINSSKKGKSELKEIIYATLDGNIYFLDLDDGQPSRLPIDTEAPHKGSVAVDPRGYPLLFAGQGIDEVGGKQVDIGYRIFSLINQQLLYFINGLDPDTFRWWGAFDSSGLLDKKTDTFIECGENGILYNIKLNTDFDRNMALISIKPDITKYRYHYQSPYGGEKLGMENSPAIYKNYIYFTDNSGLLQCVDLNTLSTVWLRNVTDDTDSSLAIDETGEGNVSLYTACEVDLRGKDDLSYVRKINALTGELIWEKGIPCIYDENVNGGSLGSPVIGKKDIRNLVIFSIAKTGRTNAGKLIAFDKKNGEEVWVINLQNYTWSSPVDVYTGDGKSYIIICDASGYMYLIEGISGKILDRIYLEGNIEGSPAVYENMIVVGTRGQKIWGIKIK
mgnify:CR=1 FL=1